MRFTLKLPLMLCAMAALLTFSGCGQSGAEQAEHNHSEQAEHTEHTAAGAEQDPQAGQEQALPNYVTAPYPLDTCVVAGGKLGSMGKPVKLEHEGREVVFCCASCEPKFKADPDKYIAKIDAAVVENQADSYPMDTCLISGDALGDNPTDYVYENRLVRFCCDMCIEPFLKDPAKHLAKLNAAAVKVQLADYPAEKCPVSGADLGSMGKPIDMMVGHRLVRLCCAGCNEKVQANPAGMLGKVYGEPKPAEAE